MLAFHSDPKIKKKYLSRVKAHIKADELIKGKYWENGKGCAVGCTIHSGDHAAYENELGIPRILARLEDGIFESLPNKLAMTWPKRFLESINPGADLSKVWNKFAHWLLVDTENGVLRFANTERTKDSISKTANLYLRSLKEEVPYLEWKTAASAAADAAADAAAYAAYAAAYAASDAAYAAYAASAAYADAAAYAAASATAYAAYDAARTKAIIAQSEKLLELLREAK